MWEWELISMQDTRYNIKFKVGEELLLKRNTHTHIHMNNFFFFILIELKKKRRRGCIIIIGWVLRNSNFIPEEAVCLSVFLTVRYIWKRRQKIISHILIYIYTHFQRNKIDNTADMKVRTKIMDFKNVIIVVNKTKTWKRSKLWRTHLEIKLRMKWFGYYGVVKL